MKFKKKIGKFFIFPFFAADCLKQTISKALGTGIIVGSTFGNFTALFLILKLIWK